MAKGLTKEMSVGIVVVLALLIFAIAVITIGEESKFFARKIYYKVIFPNSSGLRKGSPVNLSGVQIGTVSDIYLPVNPQHRGIDITMAIDKVYANRIRQGTKASLKYLQILSGEKFIELTPGDSAKPVIPPDSVIPVEEEMKIFETGENIAENMNEITTTLRTILEPVGRGEGILGQMLKDPEFGKEGLAKIKDAAASLDTILARIKKGEGLIGKLIFDEQTARDIIEIKDSVKKINSILDKVDRGEGAMGALIEEGGKGEQAIDEFKNAVARLNKVIARLESNTGFFGRLLNDEEYSEGVANDFRKLIAYLSSIAEKIDSGEGTVGALINDPTVYEDLRSIVHGIDDSKFAKGMVKHYKKKGEKESEKEKQKEEKK